MGMTWRAALVSLLLFGLFVGVWHLATMGSGPAVPMDPEYAKLVGATASQGKSAMPGPAEVGLKVWQHLKDPFYDRGTEAERKAHRSNPFDCETVQVLLGLCGIELLAHDLELLRV